MSTVHLSLAQKQQIASLIQDGYIQYNAAQTNLSKYNILYSIIDMKHTIGDDKLYRDLKRCIKHHIESAEEQDFGYDLISIDKIINFSTVLPINEQEAILKVFSRTLEENGYEEEREQITLMIKVIKIKIMKKERLSFINPFYYASVIATKKFMVYCFSSCGFVCDRCCFFDTSPS